MYINGRSRGGTVMDMPRRGGYSGWERRFDAALVESLASRAPGQPEDVASLYTELQRAALAAGEGRMVIRATVEIDEVDRPGAVA